MDDQLQTLEHARQTAMDLGIQFGPRLLVALLIIAAGFYVGRWMGTLTGSMLLKLGLEPSLRQLLQRVVRVLETFRERSITIPFPQREVRLLGQS